MADGGFVTINGLKELEQTLTAIPDKLAKNVLVGAMRAGARTVQKDARSKVPVASQPHTLRLRKGQKITIQPGWLKKNISIWRLRDRQTKYAVQFRMGIRAPKKGPLAYYGYFIERGTSKMQARPFMRPAFDQQYEAAVDAVKIYLSERIEKELNK